MLKKIFAALPHITACLTLVAVALLSVANPAGGVSPVGGVPLGDGSAGMLSGFVICVDPGHGGFDGGAVGKYKKANEAAINLSVSLKLKSKLEAAGATVILTREDNEALGENKKSDLNTRRELVKESGADILISVHQNSHPVSSNYGPGAFYLTDDELSRPFARAMQEALNEKLNTKKPRFAQHGNFFMMKTGIPSIIVECGFISNLDEEAKLLDEEYQDKVADAIVIGIYSYLGGKYNLITE